MRAKDVLSICVIILCLEYYFVGMDYVAREYAYPLPYSKTVHEAANNNNVPYYLVAAVILAESKFSPQAESDKGAVGLMQLMPETAHWIGDKMNQPKMSDKDIQEPRTNIALGTWYLSFLLREYHGNQILALAAYNAGHGHVDEWMQTYHWDYNFSDISAIPFGETRQYVRTVLKNAEHYKKLYGVH